jgi:pyruvate formate-lyase activating enzyme-like uncharacterized protein
MKSAKTKFYSWKAGALAKGCQMCVKGEKIVLFATGLCPNRCYFCPISDSKNGKDDVYANEWKIKSEKEIIKEAELCSAKGAGITGGDPLVKLDRVVGYINLLKKRFGKKFHIHLYTPLELVNEKTLKRLYDAGLDEIRFHPDIEDPSKWNRLELARKFKWDVGVEIPSIPGKEEQTMQLVDFIKGKVNFLNINELEISDSNANNLVERGFKSKDNMSYAVKGSEELAKKILKYAASKNINTHYCTAQLKDRVQLRKRILKRAENAAKKYDIITEEGMLIRGAVYLMKPSFGYMRKIEKKRKILIPKLKRIMESLNLKNAELDQRKCRILMHPEDIEKLSEALKKKGLVPAIVEEYPTWDALEVEIEFL